MQKRKISVCSDRPSLIEELKERCVSYAFEACESTAPTSILIIDAAKALGASSAKGRERTRITLGDEQGGKREFGEIRLSETRFLGAPNEWLAVAVDLADVQERVSRLEDTTTLDARVRDLLMLAELDSIYEHVCVELSKLLGVHAGWLFVHEPNREVFALVHGKEEDFGNELSARFVEALHSTHASKRPYVLLDERVALPVFARDDLIGAFVCPMEGDLEDERLDASLRYLDAVTAVISNARHMSENRDLALRDDLTKAFNRRFFESYLDEEIERTRRYGSVFSIIFLDLDDLKTINNAHGHLVGSRVLQEVAKRVLSAVRTIDKVVRFGGDEFCIILPETDKDQAKSVAVRVRNSMTHSMFKIEPDIEVAITASFGIASYPNHALTKEGLIRQADEAMYRVKSTTKNAIGVAGELESNRTETAAS